MFVLSYDFVLHLLQFIVVLYFGKSAVNPLIYGWKNIELRKTFLRALTRDGSASSVVLRKGSNTISFLAEHGMTLSGISSGTRNRTTFNYADIP